MNRAIAMFPTGLLALAGLVAMWIGATFLISPASFSANNGVPITAGASQLSELRANGAQLLSFGILIGLGIFRQRWRETSLVVASSLFGAYFFGRVVSLVVDGVPSSGLQQAAVVEGLLAFACAGVVAVRVLTSDHRRSALV